jgi:hypothetical protein
MSLWSSEVGIGMGGGARSAPVSVFTSLENMGPRSAQTHSAAKTTSLGDSGVHT